MIIKYKDQTNLQEIRKSCMELIGKLLNSSNITTKGCFPAGDICSDDDLLTFFCNDIEKKLAYEIYLMIWQ